MNEMTPSLWALMQTLIGTSLEVPAWIRTLLSYPLQSAIGSKEFHIHVDRKVVSESYLAFLDQQIELCARGPEWNQVLIARVNVLRPYVGKEVVHIAFEHGGNRYMIRLSEEGRGQVLQIEEQ